MEEPLSMSPGDLGTVAATAALPGIQSARTLVPSPGDPSVQVMAFFCNPLLHGEVQILGIPAFLPFGSTLKKEKKNRKESL